jgi:hypothetical protein
MTFALYIVYVVYVVYVETYAAYYTTCDLSRGPPTSLGQILSTVKKSDEGP